ncbi:MAG TPA: hypothetical protein PKK94_20200, partial [Leptospiraceae bacterium]|nr:hypothetical protein [Leptospiraceae bacterium]
ETAASVIVTCNDSDFTEVQKTAEKNGIDCIEIGKTVSERILRIEELGAEFSLDSLKKDYESRLREYFV